MGSLLSLRECARAIGRATGRKPPHNATVFRWVQRGRLRAVRVGGQWLVDPADIAMVIGSNAPEASAPRVTPQAAAAAAAVSGMLGRAWGGKPDDDQQLLTTMAEEQTTDTRKTGGRRK